MTHLYFYIKVFLKKINEKKLTLDVKLESLYY
jgi:hypothetical protein